jgi:hypothetical protein
VYPCYAMPRTFLPTLALSLVLVAACELPEADQPAALTAPEALAPIPEAMLAAVDSATARTHVAVVSADSMEGRGPGTPGEARAVRYIADQMRQAGLQPAGDDGSFFQQVPLLGATPTPRGPLTFTHEDGQTLTLDFLEDYIASTDLDAPTVSTEGALVFVGYGIDAPAYGWDDFEATDVTGKILVGFVNDPIAPTDDPASSRATR